MYYDDDEAEVDTIPDRPADPMSKSLFSLFASRLASEQWKMLWLGFWIGIVSGAVCLAVVVGVLLLAASALVWL